MATIKFWQEMQKVVTIDGQDKLMIGKNSTGEAMYVNVEDLNQFLTITGDSIPAIQGGSTPATAVALPAGPTGQNRFFDASWGYWKYNNVVLLNPEGGEGIPEGSDGVVFWNGTTETWSISKVQGLPTVTASDDIDPQGTKPQSQKGVVDAINLISVTKEYAGIENIPPNTEWLSELINSDMSDTTIWHQNRTYIPTTGQLSSPTAPQNDYVASVKKYEIPQGNFDFTVILQLISGNAGLCLYDENGLFLTTIVSHQDPVVFNSEGTKYCTVTHRKTLSVSNISLKNNTYLDDDANLVFAKKSKTATKEELNQLQTETNNAIDSLIETSVTKEELGITKILSGTEWATEIQNSDPLNTTIWHQDRVYNPSTGVLSPIGSPTFVGFRCTVKKYEIPQGNFDFTTIVQVISGTVGLCLYDENDVFIKTIVSLMTPVQFNSEGAKYYTLSYRSTRPVNLNSLKNNNEIPILDDPLFIPSSKEDEFVKKGDVPQGLILNRFSDVPIIFPEVCEVGKFSLVRNTNINTNNVLKDYDIQYQNYTKLKKAKIVSTKQLTYPLYDIDGNGDMFSVNGKNIMVSSNSGTSWTVFATIDSANNLSWISILENGEFLLFDRTIRGATPDLDSIGGIFVSTEIRTVFTKTMTYRNRYISPVPSWGFEQNGATIYISEYGNSTTSDTTGDTSWNLGTKADANQIWISTNYGVTFSKYVKLTELTALFPNNNLLHIHGIHYDKFWNRLWVTTGDGGGSAKSNKKLLWTDNGAAWSGLELSNYYDGDPSQSGTTPYENLQGLSMFSTNEVLLIGSDCFRNAIFRVNKRKRNEIFLEDAYLPTPNIINDITYFTGRFTRYENSPVFIPFGAGDASTTDGRNSRYPRLVATWDGLDFVEIWSDKNTPLGIPQEYFKVWKVQAKYFIHARYSVTNINYFIEIEL